MSKPSESKARELLLEIGTEEIPSKILPEIQKSMQVQGEKMLEAARIPAVEVSSFSTPRRLVFRAVGVPPRQEARTTEIVGPPRDLSFDEKGRPTQAAIGFAKSQGIRVEKLLIKKTPRGEYLSYITREPGAKTSQVLKELLPSLISSLKGPKMMRWDASRLAFPRPIRWIVALYGGSLVRFRLGALVSGNQSRGHRFLSSQPFVVKGWSGYISMLRRKQVVLDPSERRRIIEKGLARLAKKFSGVISDESPLVEQAVYLTEAPSVMAGSFDPKFLDLPAAVLVAAMTEHQGYVPIKDKDGKLLPHFLFVSNMAGRSARTIREGNEKVLHARLEDAGFYFTKDRKQTLDTRIESLKGLIFHVRLGTYHQKIRRLEKLSTFLLESIHPSAPAVTRLRRAVQLCKTDLVTGMVREFPSLQGIMGREYARIQGEDDEVARAISEHYFPRFSEDLDDPKTTTGKFLTAADRLDTLVGFFGIGQGPTGSEDPYALRRQGMGTIQVFLDEAFSRLSLGQSIETAVKLYLEDGIKFASHGKEIRSELMGFLKNRMETFLARRFEPVGAFRPDLADAVLSHSIDSPVDCYRRYVALIAFSGGRDFGSLITTFKRATRIIPKGASAEFDATQLSEKVELELLAAYEKASSELEGLLGHRRYPEALALLSRLRFPIDQFFEGVLVMDENLTVRKNRMALLVKIQELFLKVCDLSKVSISSSNPIL